MSTREIWGPSGKRSVPNVHPTHGLCAGKGSVLAAHAIDTVSCFKSCWKKGAGHEQGRLCIGLWLESGLETMLVLQRRHWHGVRIPRRWKWLFLPGLTLPLTGDMRPPPCYKFDLISDSLLKFSSFRQCGRQQNTGQTSSNGVQHPAAKIQNSLVNFSMQKYF